MNYEARIPVSTYRLQLNYRFGFSDILGIIPYLDDLGISDIYASPYFKAKQGSLHGYDIVDPNALNPEVGTGEEYDEMTRELARHGMGQILDIVPNHMCITSSDNRWWLDVLENGPSSVYANFFDIDWHPVKPELTDKVLLPFLGDQYGKVLERQELGLTFEEGGFYVSYYENKFPLTTKTFADILRYRLDLLEKRLPGTDPGLMELLSIITALNNLPHYYVRDREKIGERYREKEVIKRRLWELYNGAPEIRSLIEENVRLYNGQKGNPGSFDLLDRLLDRQPFRLSHWRVATDEINYRRFFDINQIAAVKMEGPGVFMDYHKLVFRLIGEGKITGLRVDHPDGLYNPAEYFRWLQRECFLMMNLGRPVDAGAERPAPEAEVLGHYDEAVSSDPGFKPFYVVGEKILTKGERMPENWPIFSTTGYVFMNSVNGIFVETGNAEAFDYIYTKFIGSKAPFPDVVYEKKKLIMQVAMSSEVNTLGHQLNSLSERDRHTRDFTLNSLIGAIVEVIAFFPVYRTYINASGVSDTDRKYIEHAVAKAKRKNPAISRYIYDYLRDVLLLKFPEGLPESEKEEWLGFVMKFQQVTGPVMAKGLEDTAFYVYNRLVSLNEVGGSPDRFGTPLETFHGQNIERSKFWPHALIATSTHDSKRSEDVRARINVLSEIPGEWKSRLIRWSRFNKKKKPSVEGRLVPDPNEEYLYYQTLIGTWPIRADDEKEYGDFRERIREYMLKAIREGKVNSSWVNSDMTYEAGVMAFIEETLRRSHENSFLRDFEEFHAKIAHCGMFNSLSHTLLKIASPGIPDFYQGTELWNFSLVDPDNRRPVDYDARSRMLGELQGREAEYPLKTIGKALLENKEDGMIKLFLI
ncbi:MAG TPA: malto-oligosyltrehalose synthase, partial [Dissulfurispiraceae bacterium]